MNWAVCYRQGDGTHRYMRLPPSERLEHGLWMGGYDGAFKFANKNSAELVAAKIPDASGLWLGQCSRAFAVDRELDERTTKQCQS